MPALRIRLIEEAPKLLVPAGQAGLLIDDRRHHGVTRPLARRESAWHPPNYVGPTRRSDLGRLAWSFRCAVSRRPAMFGDAGKAGRP